MIYLQLNIRKEEGEGEGDNYTTLRVFSDIMFSVEFFKKSIISI
jgi:hypothetical protein